MTPPSDVFNMSTLEQDWGSPKPKAIEFGLSAPSSYSAVAHVSMPLLKYVRRDACLLPGTQAVDGHCVRIKDCQGGAAAHTAQLAKFKFRRRVRMSQATWSRACASTQAFRCLMPSGFDPKLEAELSSSSRWSKL